MSVLGEWVDSSRQPDSWAKQLGISREAIDLYRASEVIDLHIDSFIWKRVIGPQRHHRVDGRDRKLLTLVLLLMLA